MIHEMNERAQDIFRLIVDSYLSTGEPVGSRTLSKLMAGAGGLSPASIRNVMADLEDLGLLYAPHTSAGRLPTQTGLRFFVDALMEVSNIDDERKQIDALKRGNAGQIETVMDQAGKMLAGLSSCASIVATPTRDRAIRQIQFLPLAPTQALAVLVFQDGSIENRLITVPQELSAASLTMASNYLNDRLASRSLADARRLIEDDIKSNRMALDHLTTKVVQEGLAIADQQSGHFFVRGQARLLEDVKAIEDLEAIQSLLSLLDQQETMAKLLEAAEEGQGVRIYIGSENRLFNHAGLSMVVAPTLNSARQVVGAVGVIGPTRLNYGRIVPIVDYTTQVISRLLDPA